MFSITNDHLSLVTVKLEKKQRSRKKFILCTSFVHKGYNSFFLCHESILNIVLFPSLAISCGHPGVPANAVLSGDKFTYGSIIHYSCTAGRRLIGNSTRECQEDSHWSGTLPHCSGRCNHCHLYVTLELHE